MTLRRVLAVVAITALLPLSVSALSTSDIYAQTFSLFNQIIAIQKQLIQSLDAQIADLKAQLSSANTQLAVAQNSQKDADSLRSELSMTKSVLSSANSQLAASQQQLSTANANLASTQSDLANVKSQLSACQNSPTPPKSCTFNGQEYPDGTIAPFTPSYPYFQNLQAQTAIPVSAMQMVSSSNANTAAFAMCAMPCGGYVIQYKCQNGDWVKVTTGYPYYPIALKPVIYLYPQKTEEVSVRLHYKGQFSSTYPPYDPTLGGWSVIARPDGTLTNLADGREYSYLFWEGTDYSLNIDETRGFVVKGSETREFLQEKLAQLGLTPREYNEFIVYWLPKMEHNAYNFVQFVGQEYTQSAPLAVSPRPDSMLRVFMAFKPLDNYKHVTPQTIYPFERKGFSVVEWGGTELPR